jgi:hypothetical protein
VVCCWGEGNFAGYLTFNGSEKTETLRMHVDQTVEKSGAAVEPEQWEKAKDIVGGALEVDPADRASFLEQACGQDCNLRAEVESQTTPTLPLLSTTSPIFAITNTGTPRQKRCFAKPPIFKCAYWEQAIRTRSTPGSSRDRVGAVA